MMMRKKFRSFAFLFLITIFLTINVFAQNSVGSYGTKTLATAPPTVTSPVTYWQNCSKPLVAIPSTGGTLNWYIASSGGAVFPGAPTPNTATLGSTVTYYVTQTIGGIESSPRTPIVVNVAADNGATIKSFRCDTSQIPKYSTDYTPPLTINNCVLFDWANNTLISNTYICTYSIQGGASFTEYNPKNESHYIVPNLLPGQSVELILSSATHPCVPSQKITCSVPCGTSAITPTFDPIPPYCLNDVVNLPKKSKNYIDGTWSPSPVDTSTMGTTPYTFIPDPIKFPCALKTTTLSVTVAPIEPDFTDLSVCSGAVPPKLEDKSPNGVKGFWSPGSIDNTTSAFYDFTPYSGQPCSPTNKSIYVTIHPSNTIVSSKLTVTEAFNENQIISVTDPIGANYMYQLDSGPYQTSPIFENVGLGTHSITVNDIYGCSPYTNSNVLVISYPKYFTPNGDGYNDTWKISGLSSILITKIYIFDRYGKLLKEISPDGLGWDGIYIGKQMPADDYWFTVDYIESFIPKKFKAHFSLKR